MNFCPFNGNYCWKNLKILINRWVPLLFNYRKKTKVKDIYELFSNYYKPEKSVYLQDQTGATPQVKTLFLLNDHDLWKLYRNWFQVN